MRRAAFKITLPLCVCAALVAPGCMDQLRGGIVDEDGDFGLGEVQEEESSKKGSSSKKDNEESSEKADDEEPEEKTEKKSPESEKEDPSPEDEQETTSGESEEMDPSTSGGEDTSSEESGEDSSDESPEPEEDKVQGELKLSFTTKSYGGRYGPRNVGAVWIESKDGSYLRTLKKWGAVRTQHLVRWRKASRADLTDAVTGATLKRHTSHRLAWDRKDAKGKEHGAGEYLLRLELTEENSNGRDREGPTLKIPFELGTKSETLKPDDAKGFRSIEIVTPGS